MKTQLTAGRRNEIAKLLLKDGDVKAVDLAKKFNVSTETIRKDIIALEEMGIAQKSYGGAVAVHDLIERPVADKIIENQEAKRAIAESAASLIPGGSTVFLDSGSSTEALAEQLTLRDDLTIFTNSIAIANRLSDSRNEIYCTGGRVRPSSKATVGDWALQQLRSIQISISFLGTDGFENCGGPSSSSYEETELKRTIIKQSKRSVVLADQSKYRSTGLFQYCCWKDLYTVITEGTAEDLVKEKRSEIELDTRILFA